MTIVGDVVGVTSGTCVTLPFRFVLPAGVNVLLKLAIMLPWIGTFVPPVTKPFGAVALTGIFVFVEVAVPGVPTSGNDTFGNCGCVRDADFDSEPPVWLGVCASPSGEKRTPDVDTVAVAAFDIVIVVPEIVAIVVPNGTFG